MLEFVGEIGAGRVFHDISSTTLALLVVRRGRGVSPEHLVGIPVLFRSGDGLLHRWGDVGEIVVTFLFIVFHLISNSNIETLTEYITH